MKSKGFLQSVFDTSAGVSVKLGKRIGDNIGKTFDRFFGGLERGGLGMLGGVVSANRSGWVAAGEIWLAAPFALAAGATYLTAKALRRPLDTSKFKLPEPDDPKAGRRPLNGLVL